MTITPGAHPFVAPVEEDPMRHRVRSRHAEASRQEGGASLLWLLFPSVILVVAAVFMVIQLFDPNRTGLAFAEHVDLARLGREASDNLPWLLILMGMMMVGILAALHLGLWPLRQISERAGDIGPATINELRGVRGLSNVTSTASLEQPEIVIRPDFQRAAERGVTTEAIGEAVRIATSGDFDSQVARLNLDNRQIFIRTRIADATRRDPSAIGALRVTGRDGLVPLASVDDIAFESGPSQIDRYDRRRHVAVSAGQGDMPLGQAMAKVQALEVIRTLPPSVSLVPAGGAEMGEESGAGFVTAMIAGVLRWR
ncbi:efflux RND transporter permease subunit [Caulobacter sp. LjRoot300]|uniref:efflux RND transporter permease subunit n=1 Tax=Caulobacter sp. LjRoot300 TaxID=3342321 RepID=UPI003ECF898C